MTTLGQQLQTLQALGRQEVDERSPEARKRAEQRAVERFFEDAKEHIRRCIEEGHLPSAYILGSCNRFTTTELAAIALQTFQWGREQREVPANSPYRKLWDQFAKWAAGEQLEVYFHDDHDGVGVRSWQCLCVRPDSRKLGPAPELAEGTVVLPKDALKQFGSAQAYLEHLQSTAARKA